MLQLILQGYTHDTVVWAWSQPKLCQPILVSACKDDEHVEAYLLLFGPIPHRLRAQRISKKIENL